MLLNNIKLLNDNQPVNIEISSEKITAIEKSSNHTTGKGIFFTDAIAFPGLINSHDHLDFNCFSPFGKKIYTSYTEWGNDIHEQYKAEIDAILKIPQHLRAQWGMYKNLLAGITTVVNHGEVLQIENPLIHIYQHTQNLHSVKFEKKWKWKLNNPLLVNIACAIHVGEGTDKQSAGEIDALLKWNLLTRKLVGIHAVAMNHWQAKKFKALVWCPESNKTLLGSHAAIAQLKTNTQIVFGTDSTLTGNWNVWQHLRLARALQYINDAALFETITSAPAKLWGLNNGDLLPGKNADIIIAKTENGSASWDDLFQTNPENILLIIQHGKIRLFDASLLPQLMNEGIDITHFSSVCISNSSKWVEGELPALIKKIKSYHPGIQFPLSVH
jgi:cytosine/adenosine deaminase-related metal-dependent hydrolase